jgi:hypothetical protein
VKHRVQVSVYREDKSFKDTSDYDFGNWSTQHMMSRMEPITLVMYPDKMFTVSTKPIDLS